MTRMELSIGLRLYWLHMRDDIKSWMKYCHSCAMSKQGQGRGKASLVQELEGAPFQRVAFNVIGSIAHNREWQAIYISLIDYYTKWTEAYDLLMTRQSLWQTPLRQFSVPLIHMAASSGFRFVPVTW